MAMCHEVSTGTFAAEVPCNKILETIGKLYGEACVSTKNRTRERVPGTYMVEVGNMIT
jgi:hypothetical protein